MPRKKKTQVLRLKARVDSLDTNVYEAALERIYNIYRVSDQVVLSFSGGKDSTVMLELCLEITQYLNRTLHVLHMDEEIIDPDTLDYVARSAARPGLNFHWLCFQLRHTLRSHRRTHWFTWDQDEKDIWFRDPPGIMEVEGVQQRTSAKMMSEQYMLGIFGKRAVITNLLGVRSAEGFNRLRSVMTTRGCHVDDILEKKKGVFVKFPIYDWLDDDVWLAVKKFHWDYSQTYMKMWRFGVGRRRQRVSSWGNVSSIEHMDLMSAMYPDEWERAIIRLPELLMMADNIAKDVLREYKPVGWSWQDWTRQILGQMHEEDREFWIQKLTESLVRWRRISNTPVPDSRADAKRMGGMPKSWEDFALEVQRNDRIGKGTRTIVL